MNNQEKLYPYGEKIPTVEDLLKLAQDHPIIHQTLTHGKSQNLNFSQSLLLTIFALVKENQELRDELMQRSNSSR